MPCWKTISWRFSAESPLNDELCPVHTVEKIAPFTSSYHTPTVLQPTEWAEVFYLCPSDISGLHSFSSPPTWQLVFVHDNTADHGNLKLPRFYYVCTWWHVEFSSTGILLDIDMHRAGVAGRLVDLLPKNRGTSIRWRKPSRHFPFVIMRSMGQKGCTGMRGGRIQPCARSERRT